MLRVRPKAMTVAVIVAPMIGGMITAPLLSMFVIPVAYYLMRRRRLSPAGDIRHRDTNDYTRPARGKSVVTTAD